MYGLAVDVVEGAYIVEPSSVVHVIVGQEDGVKVTDICPEHLRTEIRTGIDQDGKAAVLHQRGGPQALVARVRRAAHLAVAADNRHPLRGARSQECQFRLAHFK